jgi:hypothetical protein
MPSGYTEPTLLSGAGFAPGNHTQQTPLYPYIIKTRPFISNSAFATVSPLSSATYSPIFVPSATLPWGVAATLDASAGIGNALYVDVLAVDFSGTAIVDNVLKLSSSGAITGSTAGQIDCVELAGTPGTFIVATSEALNGTLNVYVVTMSASGAGARPLLVSSSSSRSINNGCHNQNWQLINFNGATYCVYVDVSGNIVYAPITAGGIGSATTLIAASFPVLSSTAIGVWADNTLGVLFVAWVEGTTNFAAVKGFNTSFTALTGAFSFLQQSTLGGAGGLATQQFTGNANAGQGVVWAGSAFTYGGGGSFGSGSCTNVTSAPFTYTTSAITATAFSPNFSSQSGACLVTRGFSVGALGSAVLVRTGSFDYQAPTNSWVPPTYFIIDGQCKVIGRAAEGLAPSDTSLASNSQTVFYMSQQSLAPVPVLTAPNNASLQNILLPIWRNVVEGFNQGPYTIAALNTSINSSGQQVSTGPGNPGVTTLQLGGIGPPNVIYSQPALLVLIRPENLSAPAALAAGRSQVLCGALTSFYDGKTLVEAGFHEAPHTMFKYGSATGSVNNPAGTYLYRCIYRWADANGQVHRSAPSPVLSVTQASAWNSQQIAIPLPIFTYKTQNLNLAAELYRTDNAGTVFYLVGTTTLTVASIGQSTGFGSGYLFTTITDSSYTTASANFGVAYPGYWQSTPQSNPPPSFIWQVTSQGRHFGLAQVDGAYRIYYTNIWTPGVTVEWNTNGYLQVPPELGDCRSMTVQDSNVLIFGTLGVGTFNGNGPAQALGVDGQNYNVNDPGFSNIIPIPNAAGCVGTGCPVQLPTGVMYQSATGFLTIGRDLSSQFSGQLIDQLTGVYGQQQTVYGQGILLSKLQNVLFTNPSGDSLLYDYNLNRWVLWPASIVGPISGAVQRRDGTIYLAQQLVSGGSFPSTFTFNGGTVNCGVSALYQSFLTPLYSTTGYTAPQMVLETPWLFTGQTPGGEGEFWEAGILGTYFAPHQLKVELAFNYQGYGIYSGDTQTFNVAAAPSPAYQFRVRPPGTARCWAVRFRISVLPPSGFSYSTPTPDFARITGIMLFGAAQQGNTRLGPGVSR